MTLIQRASLILSLLLAVCVRPVLADRCCAAPDGKQNATAAAEPDKTPASASTQPADVVLVRIGDRATLTQAELERSMRNVPPRRFASIIDRRIHELIRGKLFLLYLEDNPDILPESVIEAEIQRSLDEAGITSREQMLAGLQEKDITYDEFRQGKIFNLGYTAVIRPAVKMGNDLEKLREIYDADPKAWDGTNLRARQIMIAVQLYDDPDTRQAKRERMERIRDDLLSGRRTWDEALQESDDPRARAGGYLGYFTRHLKLDETLAEAAFALEIGHVSEVLETQAGFHLIQVTERRPGAAPGFNDRTVQRDLRRWVERDAFQSVLRQARQQHPIVGVQRPTLPEWVVQALDAETQPADSPATLPADQAEPAERRATAAPLEPES